MDEYFFICICFRKKSKTNKTNRIAVKKAEFEIKKAAEGEG
jgi:hypothetical protein